MPKLLLSVNVSEELLRRYLGEAHAGGEPVERLLERTIEALLEDMEEEERQPPDLPAVLP
jgi:hypothetical protein